MHLRVIDYVANPGGGVRFAVETIAALARAPGMRIDVVSSGAGLERYRRLLGPRADVPILDVPPANPRELRFRHLAGAPIVPRFGRALGLGFGFHFDVAPQALQGADVVWFPWLHLHRLPPGAWQVVGSLHDLIVLQYPDQFGRPFAKDEAETVRRWLASDARIVVSSETTARTLGELFGARRERVEVVPLSARHGARAEAAAPRREWPFVSDGFLLCPANISPHKNHEVLLDALALLPRRHPLVLTGPGTELRAPYGRARRLRARARGRNLVLGKHVFGLGYLADAEYYGLLRRARALVMPTLAEGGGSFPVWEALVEGVPVICSDIPVMREMMERTGGEVSWFDPRDPADLARAIADLDANHEAYAARARGQVSALRDRGWDAVASDYLSVLSRPW